MKDGGIDVEELSCSFCGAAQTQVRHLIRGGPDVCICDGCVVECSDVIEERKITKAASKKPATGSKSFEFTPELILKHLNQHVIGQFQAKKLLSVAVYNHYKRIGKKSEIEIQKSNVMLLGPTGSGKTHTVQHLSKLLDVPYVVVDATTFTEAGYVGDDVDVALGRLIVAANGDVARAEKGIVMIDEIDKIARSEINGGRDVRGEGVQQAFLKMVEGCVMQVNPKGEKKNPQGPLVDIDTKNILFIAGGAFSGLTDHTNKKSSALGFHSASPAEHKRIEPKDMVRYGLIPEFVGRFPVFAQFEALELPDLVKILTEPKNSIVRQYRALFALDGTEVDFTDSFLMGVAERANREGTGARGLRAILESCLTDAMYKIPTDRPERVTIDESYLPSLESSKTKPKSFGIL
jgi:ATP-dependent Clp protease ATP-binding subunit ClpX